mmetsp:Transcript_18159/g.36616  ORF Transcript_18159/g.36616 Transcript_18159/m.36616 type:complete len:102 (-) Transcript_18159:427-732(-)
MYRAYMVNSNAAKYDELYMKLHEVDEAEEGNRRLSKQASGTEISQLGDSVPPLAVNQYMKDMDSKMSTMSSKVDAVEKLCVEMSTQINQLLENQSTSKTKK